MHRVLDPRTPDVTTRGLCALGVMTKAPRPGQVKTRLVPPLTPEQAAQLNRCFLRDTAAAITAAVGHLARGIAVYTPVGTEREYIDILPNEFQLLPQRGGDFGERLSNAAGDLFQIGFASVCLIDSDSPTVGANVYRDAATLLARRGNCIVLGPSEDGGYYLIGMRRFEPRVFERIDWSTERVLEQTIERAKQFNIAVELLPVGYDVDNASALHRLADELLRSRAPSAAPHTARFLAEIAAILQPTHG